MIRNAIGHGIEVGSVREARGKPAAGNGHSERRIIRKEMFLLM